MNGELLGGWRVLAIEVVSVAAAVVRESVIVEGEVEGSGVGSR